jgi:hypothetical protein
MMHSSIQWMFVPVLLVVVIQVLNDADNHHKTPFSFCHGFTTTPTSTRLVQHHQQPTSTVRNAIDSQYYNKNDGDALIDTTAEAKSSRRDMMRSMVTSVVAVATMHSFSTLPAFASGGATAGRYT